MTQRNSRRSSPLDRFIRITSSINFELLNEDRTPVQTKSSMDHNYFFTNTAIQKLHIKNYQNALKEAFLSKGNNIFKESNKRQRNKSDKIPCIYQWPVNPRIKPLLPKEPYVKLDMPGAQRIFEKNIIDWGCTNFIATAYFGVVYFWNPQHREGFKTTEFTVKNCIRWNRTGTHLAMSLQFGRTGVYDIQKRKVTSLLPRCPCLTCIVISIEWTKSNEIITGCSKGALTHWASSFKGFENYRFRIHDSIIIKVALSCNEEYLLTSGKDGIVKVWNFPKLELIYHITLILPTKAIDWHPWKNSLLVIGVVSNFYVLNVQNKTSVSSRVYEGGIINNLSFNPKSAELIVSMYDVAEGVNYLKVLTNIDTLVDEVRCNEYRITSLLWDGTGTKLGTASTDESFCIWKYFGNSTEIEKRYLKSENKTYSTNPIRTLFNNNFGNIIR